MQFDTPIGTIVTNQQTEHPFTLNLRNYNLKEANSTQGCIGKACKVYGPKQTLEEFSNDKKEKTKQLEKRINETFKDTDIRQGIINIVDKSVNIDYESESVPEIKTLVEDVYNFRKVDKQRETKIGLNKYDDPYIDPTNPDIVNNVQPQDFTYNSYADWYAPTYNQWTRIHDDNCNEENRLRIGSKPMKYYVNQYNSPQSEPFFEYTIIGNQKQYDVRNDFERSIPTRLNPIYPSQVEPYPTNPFLGSTNPSRMYADTDGALRWGNNSMRDKKSAIGLSEKDYNRYDIVSAKTVQNAGQFNKENSESLYYDYNDTNHVIYGNSSNIDGFGIPTRNLLHNMSDYLGY